MKKIIIPLILLLGCNIGTKIPHNPTKKKDILWAITVSGRQAKKIEALWWQKNTCAMKDDENPWNKFIIKQKKDWSNPWGDFKEPKLFPDNWNKTSKNLKDTY